jgi:hypothetical protein
MEIYGLWHTHYCMCDGIMEVHIFHTSVLNFSGKVTTMFLNIDEMFECLKYINFQCEVKATVGL